jgi:hypothetical protein
MRAVPRAPRTGEHQHQPAAATDDDEQHEVRLSAEVPRRATSPRSIASTCDATTAAQVREERRHEQMPISNDTQRTGAAPSRTRAGRRQASSPTVY